MVDPERLLGIFLDLVRLDSLTFKEKKVADYIGEKLRKLNVAFEVDSAGEAIGGNTGNIIAKLSGGAKAVPVLFAAHMDTVAPGVGIKPVVKNGVVRSKGKTILGADDKVGCAIILEALHILKEGKFPFGPLEIIFTVAEEKGLLGAKNLSFKKLQSRFGFVLDGDERIGNITVKAPYQDSLKVVFRGKAAHAGVNPEKGINSIQTASIAISKMKLGRIDEETTANIGVIEGGRAMNIVPEETVIEGEARSHSLSKLKAQVKSMVDCIEEACQRTKAKAKVKVERLYDGFAFTEKDEVVRLAMEAVKRIGVKPGLTASGGGSDTNVLNKAGIPTVNLSIGARDVHTTEESVKVDDMVKATEMVVKLIQVVAEQVGV